jgi:transcriptional regulator with XRE-family HTH domain
MRQTETDSGAEARVLLAPLELGEIAAQIGERIARFRRRLAWSRVELAERLGVRRDRLAKWELGKNPPPVEMLARLARTLGVSADELLTGEPPAEAPLTQEQWQELALYVEALHRLLRESRLAVFLPGGNAQGGRR